MQCTPNTDTHHTDTEPHIQHAHTNTHRRPTQTPQTDRPPSTARCPLPPPGRARSCAHHMQLHRSRYSVRDPAGRQLRLYARSMAGAGQAGARASVRRRRSRSIIHDTMEVEAEAAGARAAKRSVRPALAMHPSDAGSAPGPALSSRQGPAPPRPACPRAGAGLGRRLCPGGRGPAVGQLQAGARPSSPLLSPAHPRRAARSYASYARVGQRPRQVQPARLRKAGRGRATPPRPARRGDPGTRSPAPASLLPRHTHPGQGLAGRAGRGKRRLDTRKNVLNLLRGE